MNNPSIKELLAKYPTFDEKGAPAEQGAARKAEKKPTLGSVLPSTTEKTNRRGRPKKFSKTKE